MEVPLLHLLYCLSSCQCPYLSVCVPVIVDVCMSMCLCTQLTVIRLVMRDTTEETLYKRNNERDVAEVSLSITSSSSSQHGVEVRRPYHHRHHQCRHAWHLTDADIFYCTLLFHDATQVACDAQSVTETGDASPWSSCCPHGHSRLLL